MKLAPIKSTYTIFETKNENVAANGNYNYKTIFVGAIEVVYNNVPYLHKPALCCLSCK